MAELEPGWLMRTVHEAHMLCMLNNDPAALRHLTKIETPISNKEADELYSMMNERFKKWTGRDLPTGART